MRALAKWSVNNRVTVNLIMAFVVIAGIYTVKNMRREIYPQFALDMVNITIVYPGATPMETEEGLCIKVEEQIKGIEGIKRMVSTAREGSGSITVELNPGVDVAKILNDIKTEVDRIDSFPEEAEDPIITEIVNRNPAISVAVYGDLSELQLRKMAERVRDDLLDLDGISLAELVGVRNYEISVEVSEEDLRRYGLSFDAVVAAIKTGSIDLPGGSIKTEHGEILVRAKGQLYTGREFEKLPLITRPDGTEVRLGQVARVKDGFEDVDVKTRFNGRPAALVQVNRTSEEDLVKIARQTKTYVKSRKNHLPAGVSMSTWMDLSTMVQDRIDLLLRNGIQGIVLVFLTLAFFLNLRLAFWVSAGIPVAFMGAFLILNYLGATLNMISLFAFIMTLGIVVDDAIIVGEDIYTHYGQGKPAAKAVVDGLGEVGAPVVMAVGTTVVAFIPLMFVAGIMGKFIAVMPQAVIIILLVSLGEALVILPAHLKGALTHGRPPSQKPSWHARFRRRIDNGLEFFIKRIYARAINYVVRNRYFTLAVGLGILIVSLGLVEGGYVPFVFFPKGESNWIIAEINYPLGTPFSVTEKTAGYMEQKAFSLNDAFRSQLSGKQDLVVNTFALVGYIRRRDWKPAEYGGHVGEVWVEITPSEKRPGLSVNTVINAWRKAVGEIAGIDKLAFFTIEGGPAGNPIEIQLAGNDFKRLSRAAEELKAEIKTYPGAFNISDDFKPGKQEKQIRIKDGARAVGVTMYQVARQLRQAFYGEEAARIQRDRDDVKVMVRYSEEDRRRIGGIEQMRIRTADGREVPLTEVAEILPGRAYSTISRVDRKRVITVSSDLDENVANASQIVEELNAKFLPDLMARYPGMKYDLEGAEKRTRESLDSIYRGFALALMGIFLLLASQFRSYIQPVVIMVAIPFGFVGAIAGHLIMGLEITIISIFGIVALAGIVVNDALILIDFINRAVRSGVPLEEAVKTSGQARFRPVLLTSITTVAGLFPLLLERSFQAQFLVPMAVSISFGLIAATLLTLLYVPALYLIVQDVAGLFGLGIKAAEKENPIV